MLAGELRFRSSVKRGRKHTAVTKTRCRSPLWEHAVIASRQAGLPAVPGISPFPAHLCQWIMKTPDPVGSQRGCTAAGPLPIFTGFPIKPKRHLGFEYAALASLSRESFFLPLPSDE